MEEHCNLNSAVLHAAKHEPNLWDAYGYPDTAAVSHIAAKLRVKDETDVYFALKNLKLEGRLPSQSPATTEAAPATPVKEIKKQSQREQESPVQSIPITSPNPESELAQNIQLSNYYCSTEWHLYKAARKQPLVGYLYTLAQRISQKTGEFYASGERLADYFDCNRKTIYDATDILVKTGFFIYVGKTEQQANIYKPIYHDDWVITHPNQCVLKAE